MEKTVDILYNSVLDGTSIDHPAVIVDYFGGNFNDEIFGIIYGLYEGLIKFKGVTKKLLYDCFINNQLDELIHKKYTIKKSGYYKEFCEKNIKIGKTRYNLLSAEDIDEDDSQQITSNETIEITTDDFCPTCNSVGFYTKKNYITDNAPDCYYCENLICNLCKISHTVNVDGMDEHIYHCNRCDLQYKNPNMITAIKKKINDYKRQDIDKGRGEGNVTIDDVFQLLKIQNFKCYVCGDEVKTSNWKPYCLYQVTLDRINEKTPHNRDNVLVCCLYCNCRDMYMSLECSDQKMKKICDNGCHCKERIDIRRRTDVTDEEINSIKLT